MGLQLITECLPPKVIHAEIKNPLSWLIAQDHFPVSLLNHLVVISRLLFRSLAYLVRAIHLITHHLGQWS